MISPNNPHCELLVARGYLEYLSSGSDAAKFILSIWKRLLARTSLDEILLMLPRLDSQGLK